MNMKQYLMENAGMSYDEHLRKEWALIGENFINDYETYGEEVVEIYSSLLGESGKTLVEAIVENKDLLVEASATLNAGDVPGMAGRGSKISGWTRAFGNSFRIGPDKAAVGKELAKTVGSKNTGALGAAGGVFQSLWGKIKAFGAKIPAALKGFASKGIAFFAANPWAGVVAALGAAGLGFVAARKLLKKAGRKITPEQEAELKAKLSAEKAKDEKAK